MTQFDPQILKNAKISEDLFELSLAWDPDVAGADADAAVPRPGQFLTIRVSPDSMPLLRRPFAFASFDGGAKTASIIYQVRGRGTEILAAKRAGERIDVVGPLGGAFSIDGDIKNAVVVAGGVGLGPMLFLSSELTSSNIPHDFIFGCKSKQFIPNVKCFYDVNPHICTDDGSYGFAGNVVDSLKSNSNSNSNSLKSFFGDRAPPRNAPFKNTRPRDVKTGTATSTSTSSIPINSGTIIYACGPTPMLRSLSEFGISTGVKVFVSLEAVMACGVGACMGCAVPMAKGGYARVCKEGPVFDGGEVLWDAM